MAKQKQDKKNKKANTTKYRLVLRHSDNFEERYSMSFSKWRLIFLLMLGSLFWVFITSYMFMYSPLRNYISNDEERLKLTKQSILLQKKVDSLDIALSKNQFYIENIKLIIQGEYPGVQKDSTAVNAPVQNNITYDSINDIKNDEDSILRSEMADNSNFGIYYQESEEAFQSYFQKHSPVFFAPLKGYITQQFAPNKKHMGIDIVAKENTPIKSIGDGVVIFAQWTIDNGFVIIIQHMDNTISAYKHNASLLKHEGDYVKAGDLIAIIGNSGDQSSGLHLHFELWINGVAVNPTDYISFQ